MRRVIQCLEDFKLPLWDSTLNDFDVLMAGLEEFRQHLGGRLTITMLRAVGDPIDVHEIDPDAMRASVEQLRYLTRGSTTSQK